MLWLKGGRRPLLQLRAVGADVEAPDGVLLVSAGRETYRPDEKSIIRVHDAADRPFLARLINNHEIEPATYHLNREDKLFAEIKGRDGEG